MQREASDCSNCGHSFASWSRAACSSCMHFADVCTDPDPRQAAVMSNFGISLSAAAVIWSPATTAAATKGALNRNITSSHTRLSPRTSVPILDGSAQPVELDLGPCPLLTSKADMWVQKVMPATPESGHGHSDDQARLSLSPKEKPWCVTRVRHLCRPLS